MRRLFDRLLVRFDKWFSSEAGVYQTVLITLAIAACERIFPHADPHGFWLLYWLTVYSAVTQPALAHTGREQMERLQAIEEQQFQQIVYLTELLKRRHDLDPGDGPAAGAVVVHPPAEPGN